MRVSIHQPNFMPWYPFFQKMASVDVFVLLAQCQFEKGKYQNRFKFQDRWYTMSVNHGLEPIVDKRYTHFEKDWNLIKTRLPQFSGLLGRFDDLIEQSLNVTNTGIIVRMANMLGIKTEIIWDLPTTLKSTDRLVRICESLGANTYVAGQSGADYLEPEKFNDAGIKVEYQDLSAADKRHTLEVLNAAI